MRFDLALRLALPALIQACAPPPLQLDLAPLHAPNDERCVSEAVRIATLGLSGDDFDGEQTKVSATPPLQVLPRVTAPVFAAPCPEAGGAWHVPILFGSVWGDRDEYVQPDLDSPDRLPSPSHYLEFWLESGSAPHGKRTYYHLNPETNPVTTKPSTLRRSNGESSTAKTEAVVFAIPTSGAVPAGFHWVRILPRFVPRSDRTSVDVVDAIEQGDLGAITGFLDSVNKEGGPPLDVSRIEQLQESLQCGGLFSACSHPYKHFWARLEALGDASRALVASAKGTTEIASGPAYHAFWSAVGHLYEDDLSPGGAYLDDDPQGSSFSFIVAADVQEGEEPGRFRSFLRVVDPHQKDPARPWVSKDVRERVQAAKFVLLAGDFADAEASSNYFKMGMNVLGLVPPWSPYEDEFPPLRAALRSFSKPFVAVPGNHDAYVGYHGILNLPFAYLHGLSPKFDAVNDYIPVIAKPPLPVAMRPPPRYDGLQEWRYELGPTSYGFRFRGHGFIGLNSYELEPYERAAVGAVVFNWGGGVQPQHVAWFGKTLKELGDPHSLDFAFMHQDPRGAYPLEYGEVDHYGLYDEVETWSSTLTMGHFGLGHSPYWDVYIPILTPASHQGTRFLEGHMSKHARGQEEWMRRSANFATDPGEHYGAKGLTRTINAHLYGSEGPHGLAALFFGHDNHPAQGHVWAEPGPTGGVVFPQQPHEEWTGEEFHSEFDAIPWLPHAKTAMTYMFKFRNDEPPEWATEMDDIQGNAEVVRLDDIADTKENGFVLVTVGSGPDCAGNGGGPTRACVEYVPLQR